jgi:hypothetical protein
MKKQMLDTLLITGTIAVNNLPKLLSISNFMLRDNDNIIHIIHINKYLIKSLDASSGRNIRHLIL